LRFGKKGLNIPDKKLVVIKKMRNAIPLKYRIRGTHKGAIPQKRDYRDIVLGDIAYTPDPKCPSWEEGYDNEEKYGTLDRNHQGFSLSCTGQAVSKYLEMLNLIETKKKERLSSRYVYSQIYLQNGGAYIRDAVSIPVKQGVALEKDIPSYDINGNPPSEALMRINSDITDEIREKAKKYKSLKYVWLDADKVNDDMRQIIWQNGGFPSGYNGHCEYFSKFGLVNGRKAIRSMGSYGEISDRWITEDSSHRMYDIMFLVDLPNPPDKINMLKIILDNTTKKQYLLGKDGKYRWIYNEVLLNELHDSGIVDKNHVEPRDSIDSLLITDTWACIK